MAGSKSEKIAKKLKAVGQWDAFTERKLELLSNGIASAQAYKQAVSEFAKYLTFDNPGPPRDDGDAVQLPAFVCLDKKDFAGKKSISDKEAINWAIENCGFVNLKAADAPSSTAWMYVLQFRQNGEFFRDVLKKRVPNISKIEQDGAYIDDGRKQFTLLEKLRAESSQD